MEKNPFLPLLKKQLGRTPKGNFLVVKICPFGFPVVIKNPPLVKGQPFPTNFWLTCPHLIKEVSRLEERGFIKHFEEKLKYDHRFRNRYLKAHQEEVMLRKPYLTQDIPPKIKCKLLKGGIGGIENPTGVKCLHLHLASYLGGMDNPIGEEVYKKINRKWCSVFSPTEGKCQI
ncbi:MAG: DUF501 domain-containing protein [Aquificota bacterium]|jgi:hypothetical protein